jgi:hypothetical protein
MDPIDNFYQALDSEQVLKRHGPGLLAEARRLLAEAPSEPIAGLITMPDSNEAEALRSALGATASEVPAGTLMIGIVPRAAVEGLLASRCGDVDWREEPWQQQQVLPVVVSTKDGFRFGFFGLGAAPGQ